MFHQPSHIREFEQAPTRTILALIGFYVVLWTGFAALSRYNLDTHGDMLENFAWGIGWQAGYYKHPPLFGWITAAWFSVFPRLNVSYQLLSAISIAVALFAIWRISTRFFSAGQQVLALALVFFLPPLTFLAANYNATSAMVPFWALAFLFYLRVIERRAVRDAVVLGALAGLAVLTKYHSIVLLLAIFGHAAFDREVRPLLGSPLPWIAGAVAAAIFAPHFLWMIENDFATLRYASEQGQAEWLNTVEYAARFLPTLLLYTMPALLLFAAHRFPRDGQPLFDRGQLAALRSTVKGRALLWAALAPPLLTIALGLALNAEISSLWGIPFFPFVALLMTALLPPSLVSRGRWAVPLMLLTYAAALMVAAPIFYRSRLAEAESNSSVPMQAIARAVQAAWRDEAGTPLAIVAGETHFLANGSAFYASDRPFAIQGQSLSRTPWVSRADIKREGAAFLCFAPASLKCARAAGKLLGRVDREASISVPGVQGAGGPANYPLSVRMRFPDRSLALK